jgi:hypothetical protein
MYSFFAELLEHAAAKTNAATTHNNAEQRKGWEDTSFTAVASI